MSLVQTLGVADRRASTSDYDVAFTKPELFQSVVLNLAMGDGGPIDEVWHYVCDAKKLRPNFFLLGAGGVAVVNGFAQCRQRFFLPAFRDAVSNANLFVAGEAEAYEPLPVKQPRRFLQQPHPPPVVLNQLVVGGE